MPSPPSRRPADTAAIQSLQLLLDDKVELNERTLLEGVAEYYNLLGRTAEALQCLQEAKNLHRKSFDYPGDARVLRKLGLIYLQRGERAAAVRSWQQSIHAAREIDDRRGEAAAQDLLAALLQSEGRYTEAIHALEETLGLKDTAGDRIGQARTLVQLGGAYQALGQYQEALRCFRQSLRLWKAEGNVEKEAHCLEEIVGCYLALGRFADLVRTADEVFALHDAMGRKSDRSTIYLQTALAWTRLGQWAAAHKAYGQALDAARSTKRRSQQVLALLGQGRLLREMGRAADAVRILHNAETEAKAGDARHLVGDVLLELGTTHLALGQWSEGQKILGEAVKLFKAGGADDRAADAAILMAGAVMKGSGAAEGELHIVAAHGLAQGAGDTHQLAVITTLRGAMLNGLGQAEEALRWFKDGLELVDDPVGLGRHTEEDLLGSLVRPFESATDLALSSGEVQFSLLTAQRAHAHACVRAAERLQLPDKTANGNGAVGHCERLVSQIRGCNARLVEMETPAARHMLREQLQALRTDLHKQQETTEHHHPEYAPLRFVRTLSPNELQKLLPTDTAVVTWLVGETQTFLWVLKHDELVPFICPVGREFLTRAVSALVTALEQKEDLEALGVQARDLTSALFTDVFEHLAGGITRLVVVPDGILMNLPFGVLVTPEGKYFSELWDVAVVPSLPLWRVCHQRSQRTGRIRGTRRVLAVSTEPQPAAHTSGTGRGLLGGHGAPAGPATPFPPPPPADDGNDAVPTVVEIARTHRLDEFETLARKAGLLHLSTPIEITREAAFASSFQLQDGGVSIQDLVRLTFTTPLALLSDTQAPASSTGREWLMLMLPLVYAGLSSAVFTRWRIDEGARRLFADTLFTQLIAGQTKADAVRTARRQVAVQKQYAHPHFWAAFELFGDVG